MRLDTLLSILVAHNTQNPGGDEVACATWLSQQLAARQPDSLTLRQVTRPRGPDSAYVLATWGTPRLLINVHIDTVPAVAGWTADPLTLRHDGDKRVGLGAVDVKGAVAALLVALERVPPRDCAILLSGDEEKDSRSMMHFLAHHLPPGLELAVVCEPTGCHLGTRHRGILVLQAEASGPGGHSSSADSTAAPVANLCAAGAALTTWGQARRDLGPPGFPGLCLNVASLTGGVDYNIIPAQARLTLSMRPPPGTDVQGLAAEASELLLLAAPGLTVRTLLAQPPFAAAAPEAVTRRFGAAAPACIDLPFWTEGALLAARGINTVIFGPGDIAQAHLADEFVAVAQLERATSIFETLLRGL